MPKRWAQQCRVDPSHVGPFSRNGLCPPCRASLWRAAGQKGGSTPRRTRSAYKLVGGRLPLARRVLRAEAKQKKTSSTSSTGVRKLGCVPQLRGQHLQAPAMPQRWAQQCREDPSHVGPFSRSGLCPPCRASLLRAAGQKGGRAPRKRASAYTLARGRVPLTRRVLRAESKKTHPRPRRREYASFSKAIS